MQLQLKRPLAFFDLESTGINSVTDRIVEIAILKVQPDGSKEAYTKRINPTIPIPAEASAVHGIYEEDIALMPTFKEVAPQVDKFLVNCDLAGFNSNRFDIPMLVEEFLRAGVAFAIEDRKFLDAQVIFHKMEERTLAAAYKFYCSKDLENAHSAEADINATFEVLEAQIERYSVVQGDVDFLHEFSLRGAPLADFSGRIAFDDQGREIFNFGKHKGKLVEAVFKSEPGYYSWMMEADFALYTKQLLTKIWKRMQQTT